MLTEDTTDGDLSPEKRPESENSLDFPFRAESDIIMGFASMTIIKPYELRSESDLVIYIGMYVSCFLAYILRLRKHTKDTHITLKIYSETFTVISDNSYQIFNINNIYKFSL